jgi:GDP-D-mannose 3',5'-epimerase
MDLFCQKVVVCGGGGFIGGHLIKQLLEDGVNVIRSVDVKPHSEWYQIHPGVENVTADLKEIGACRLAVEGADAIFNLAADMGGMGFIESRTTKLCACSAC